MLGLSAEKVTGRGAGLSDEKLALKKKIVERAVRINHPDAQDPLDILAKLGGFDIAAMILSSLLPGALAVGLALIWFLCFCLFSRKTFGGITGDITGFCIQMTEFWILLGTVIGGLIR